MGLRGGGRAPALRDLGIGEAYVVAPVRGSYPLADGVEVVSLGGLLTALGARGPTARGPSPF